MPVHQVGRRAARGAAILALARPFRIGIMLTSTAVLARLLEPRDFGLVGMAVAVTRFLEIFRQVGLGTATIQREQMPPELSNALFWVNVAVAFVLALLTAAAAPGIAWFYGEQKLVGIVCSLALGLAISGAEVQHSALLKRAMRFKALMAVELIAAFLAMTVGIGCALLKMGYWALVAQTLTQQIGNTVGAFWVSGFRISLPRWAPGAKESIKLGLDVSGFNIINFFSRNADDILIGRFIGASALAFYQKAYELMMLPIRHVTGPSSAVALPTLSRLNQDPSRYRDAYGRMLDLVLLVSTPVAAWLVGAADWIIVTILGDRWLQSADILRALGFCLFLQPLASTSGWLFTSQGRTREMFRWGIFGAVISIVGFLIGIRWGIIGVAWSYSIGFSIRLPLLLWFIGSSGPVTWRHLVRKLGTFAPASALALTTVCLLRWQVPDLHALLGAATGGLLAAAATLLGVAVTPGGRRALGSLSKAGQLLANRP